MLTRPLAKGRLFCPAVVSAMTRRQVAAYKASRATLQLNPLDLAKKGVQPALGGLHTVAADQPKMVFATAEPQDVRAYQQALGCRKIRCLCGRMRWHRLQRKR